MTAASGDQSVTLTWNDPSDSTITRYEYRVNHNATGTGNLSGWSPWKDIPNSDSATTSHAFTGLTNGSEYRYKIRAVTEIGEGNDAPSTPAPTGSPWYVSATPQGAEPLPVSKFWAERVCDDSFKVRWKRVPGATGYDLNLSRDHRKSWRRLMTNKNYNAWQFSQWDKDRTYWFAIRAVNAHGASAWTDLQSIALPCPVEGLRASYAPNGNISVEWNPAKRANSYDVNFSADAGRSWQRMGSNLSATTYSFNKAPDALPYNPNFLVAVQSRKGGMTGGWRNAPVARVELTASDITTTTATLTLANHSGRWLYKRTTPGGDDTCHSVAAGTSTAALSGLDADNLYTYKAYGEAGCASGDEIASATFYTQLTVSNLSEAGAGPNNVGTSLWATGFTTGSHPAGYTLQSATARVLWAGGSDALTWAIHASTTTSGNDVPSSTAQATLTGSRPTEATYADFTYTCDGSGCALSPNTTYFLVASTGSNSRYWWENTTSLDETAVPSGNGWAIGTGGVSSDGGATWTTYNDAGKFKVSATANP